MCCGRTDIDRTRTNHVRPSGTEVKQSGRKGPANRGKTAMSNALKGMVAGLVATLVLSGLMVLNSATDLMPQIHIIRWLTAPGTLSVPAAWMDHFVVGVIIWGLLFAVYDG